MSLRMKIGEEGVHVLLRATGEVMLQDESVSLAMMTGKDDASNLMQFV